MSNILLSTSKMTKIFSTKKLFTGDMLAFLLKKADIWIFIQVNMSVTVDPQVLLEAPLFTYYISDTLLILIFILMFHTQRSPTAETVSVVQLLRQ